MSALEISLVTRQLTIAISCLGRLHGGWRGREVGEHSGASVFIFDLVSLEHASPLVLTALRASGKFGTLLDADVEYSSNVHLLARALRLLCNAVGSTPFSHRLLVPALDLDQPLPLFIE